MQKIEGLKPEILKQFQPFQGLDTHQLLLLIKQVKCFSLTAGHKLFQVGDIDSNEYFLLEGEITFISHDGTQHNIKHDQPVARRQLSRLRPRQFTASAASTCKVLIIDADVIEGLQDELTRQHDDQEDYSVNEVESLEALESQELLNRFKSALKRNQFVLPSLPEVAFKVRRLLESDDSSADDIATVVNADPAIAVKLVRAANSPIYHGANACESTRNAVVRLGLDTTRQLVMSFAVHDLFEASTPELKSYMRKAWQDSIEVAAISLVLGRKVRLAGHSAEEVMLAGLLHNIGVIAVVAFIESGNETIDADKLPAVIEALAIDASEVILQHWKFSNVFVQVVRESGNWLREHPFDADLCDEVLIARLHHAIRHKRLAELPPLNKISALRRLPLGEVTPELTITILEESREQIDEARKFLAS